MQQKLDADASTATKVLRLYQRLLLDGRKHFQTDLAGYLCCSPQTVMRLIAEIETVIGSCLLTGMEKHKRWYQIRSISRNRLGLEFEELRYLAICRDLAEPYLPEAVRQRVDQSIFNFSMLMADEEYAEREKVQKNHVGYCAKGWINYTPYFGFMEKLVLAADEKRICLIRYKAPTGKSIKEHRFAVGRIVCMNNALYVLGASVTEDFKNMRFLMNLAIHRIKDIILTDKPVCFDIPKEDIGLFGLPWHEPQTFRIRFEAGKVAEYVQERNWSEKQTIIKEAEGSIILEIVSRSRPEIEAWVRSFGDSAKFLDDDFEV